MEYVCDAPHKRTWFRLMTEGEAVAESLHLIERCRFSLDELKYEYPDESRAGYATPQEALIAYTEEGARRRYPHGIPKKVRKALDHVNNDPTVLEHMGDLYQKTDRLKLAAGYWERALQEWNKTVSAEVDQTDVAKVQHKLDDARVKLANNGTVVK